MNEDNHCIGNDSTTAKAKLEYVVMQFVRRGRLFAGLMHIFYP